MKYLTPLFLKYPNSGYLLAASQSLAGWALVADHITTIGGLILIATAIPTSILTLMIKYRAWKQMQSGS